MGISPRFRIRTKLMLSALAFVVPIGTMAGLIVQGYTYDIRFSTLELYGNRMIAPLTDIAANVVRASGAAGDAETASAVQAAERVDGAVQELLTVHQAVGEDLQFTPEGLALRGRDELMPPAVAARWEQVKRTTGAAREDATAAFFADVTEMIVHAGDTSNLILDPDLDSYYLMDVTLLGVPALLTGVYSAASAPVLSAVDAAVERELLRRELDRIEGSIQTAINEDPNFYGELAGLAEALTPALRRYRDSVEPLDTALTRIVNGGNVGVAVRHAAAIPALQETIAFWNTVAEQQNLLLERRVATYRRGLIIAIVLSVVATALAFTIVILIGRAIVRQVGDTQRALATAADKDLTVHITARSRDELGVAAEAAGLLIGNMRSFVQWLRTQAANTRSHAEQLADGGVSLQESSNSVASGVEELSAAVEQFSRTLEQIEQNARRQETLAAESSREAAALRDGYAAAAETMDSIAQTSADNTRVSEESVHVVAETIDDVRVVTDDLSAIGQAVRSAGEASSGVDPIVATVRDIAERTSLLAMNAAIEAAHAGDRGRGFAVVAGEIRALSARTSEALQQIETQLTTLRVRISEAVEATSGAESHATRIGERTARARDSLETVRTNAASVGRMITTIQEAVTAQTGAVQRVSGAVGDVGEISAGVLSAIAEQSAGAHEMVDSVRVIKEASEHNRAIANDVSALSQTLTDQSREIDEQVSEYQVDQPS